jgi:chemotaxis protein MotB
VEGRNQNRRVLVVVMSDRPAAPRDHITPEHVDEVTGLAASPAAAVEMMPTVRVSSGGNRTPAQVAGSTESPALPDVVAGHAGGPAHRTNSSK